MTRVLLVDDHAGFRARTRRSLELSGWEVVAEAEDGAGGLRLAREHAPDVVLLDVGLPDRSGLEISAELARTTDAKVILVSTRDPDDLVWLLPASGALGFVPKDELTVAALETLLHGTRRA